MSVIYYVRHGQTDQNRQKILTGHTDVPLNEEGFVQAELAANKLKQVHFDIAFVSPLNRAKQTAEIINKFHDLEVRVDNLLIERDYGDYTGKTINEINREISWNFNLCDKAYPNIESPKQMFKRVKEFINMLKTECKDKTILVVAHSGIGRMFQIYFNGVPNDGNLLKLSLGNAEVAKFEF